MLIQASSVRIASTHARIKHRRGSLARRKATETPQLVWAGAEHTLFGVPTVSPHVHERIEPRTIIEAVRRKNGQHSLLETVGMAGKVPMIG
jgi:hypothetical protein